MQERRPVHVSAADGGLAAVCNDGTVWTYNFGDPSWRRQPDIPQDPTDDDLPF
jgi:hypothetical protein